MASSSASRSYTNAGISVSSPKGTTLKVDVLRCCELFRILLPSSVARQSRVGLGLLKKPFPGQPSSCQCSLIPSS
ncbi:hypothetical protein TNCV_3057481 [Trichonephila clavipes]|nr:hypothetical protein TNCV_3057481 [Trichonephila clavipes]